VRKIFFLILVLVFTLGCSTSFKRSPASVSVGDNCRDVIKRFHERLFQYSKSQKLKSRLFSLRGREVSDIEEALKSNAVIREIDNEKMWRTSTNPKIVLLEGNIKALWKEHKKNIYSNYRAEVLAWELDQLWGLQLVPEAVERTIDGRVGSMHSFKDGITGVSLSAEINGKKSISGDRLDFLNHNLKKQSLFDFLIENNDRNITNFLFTLEGRIYSIDNASSFTGIGNFKKTFADREKDIRDFLSTEEGVEVLKKILNTYTNDFKKEVIYYLGKKDANRFFERIELIISLED